MVRSPEKFNMTSIKFSWKMFSKYNINNSNDLKLFADMWIFNFCLFKL